MQTVVVSAVNIRKGGTLTILRQCLEYLSKREDVKTIALVHDHTLCEYPGIEYIDIPWTIKSWGRRLWCEYVTMHKISKQLAQRFGEPVDVWLSLHDTTPRVVAKKQEVYCHTSFPFLKWNLRDLRMDPKIPLFAMFTKFAYRINVYRNDNLIVQQEWFADALSSLLHVDRCKFRVIPPASASVGVAASTGGAGKSTSSRTATSSLTPPNTPLAPSTPIPSGVAASIGGAGKSTSNRSINSSLTTSTANAFLYVSTPDCHKNFETLCEAARLLEKEGLKFDLTITVSGNENKYAKWLYKKWGDVKSIHWVGRVTREEIFDLYAASPVFIFPSRVETWGLPISEYMAANQEGVMLLADLPYAHETSKGAKDARFFEAMNAGQLADMMKETLKEI